MRVAKPKRASKRIVTLVVNILLLLIRQAVVRMSQRVHHLYLFPLCACPETKGYIPDP